jgi:membrane-associated protein
MSELATSLFANYGLVGVALALGLAQFGLPLPTSILLMSLGAVLGTSDFGPIEIFAWAFGGAVAGDQAGYLTGRLLGASLENAAAGSRFMASGLARARAVSDRWGPSSVFFSRWLVSPAGPWINLTSGATRMEWAVFVLWDICGEAIWVAGYMTLGYAFAAYISGVAAMIANAGWALGALAVAAFTGWQLWRRLSTPTRRSRQPEPDAPVT